jgi:hypothetical protein
MCLQHSVEVLLHSKEEVCMYIRLEYGIFNDGF